MGYRGHKVKIRMWEDPVAQAQAIFAAVPRDYRVGRHQPLLGIGGADSVLLEEAG